jgi:hypothetical protein
MRKIYPNGKKYRTDSGWVMLRCKIDGKTLSLKALRQKFAQTYFSHWAKKGKKGDLWDIGAPTC